MLHCDCRQHSDSPLALPRLLSSLLCSFDWRGLWGGACDARGGWPRTWFLTRHPCALCERAARRLGLRRHCSLS
jgi:hypothetical protein